MVNGTLIDTELEMRSKPIAIPRGFRSGLARAIIFLNEDALFTESPLRNDEGRIRDKTER